MTQEEKEVQQSQLDDERELIRMLKLVYGQAQDDCVNRIIDLSRRRDMENLQSIIYQQQYQDVLRGQLDAILDNLWENEYETLNDYLNGCYESGFIGAMYDIAAQGVPLIIPIDQSQVVKAVQLDSKINGGLYKRLGEDVDELKKAIRFEVARGIANGSSWLDVGEQLSKSMKHTPFQKAINNSIRIARTEGHRIQNQAALDAQHKAQAKGADIVKQWDSTLDGKTRPTHRLLDGQLRELDDDFELQGNKASAPGQFNDPAEDCNCRCALLQRARWALGESELETLREKASFHGLRVDDSKEYGHEKAKDFSDYFSKYMVATKSEEGADSGSVRDEARKINGKVRNAEELQAAAENIKLNIDNCSNNASLWSGRINVDNKRLDGMNASGCKEWNCDITLKDTSTDATIQHELLHSCSVSYYDEDVFRENQKIEEASVEFLNKQICKERKMESDGTYSELVMILEAINKACNFGTDMEFAKELFNQPLPERYEWLEAKVIRWLMESNATATDADEVIKFIGRLADNETE